MMPRRPSWTFRLALLSVAFLVGWSLLAFVQAVFRVRLPGLPRDEAMLLAIIPLFAVAVGFAIVDIMSNTRIVAEQALGENAPEPGWGRSLRRATFWFCLGLVVLGLLAAGFAKVREHRIRVDRRATMEATAHTIVMASRPLLDSLRVDTMTVTRFRELGRVLQFVATSYDEVGRLALVLPCGVPGRRTLCQLDAVEDLPDDLRGWQPPVEPVPYVPVQVSEDRQPCDGEGCLDPPDLPTEDGEGSAATKDPAKVPPDAASRWVPPPEPKIDLRGYPWEIELELREKLEANLAAREPKWFVELDRPYGDWVQVFAPMRLQGVWVYLVLDLK